MTTPPRRLVQIAHRLEGPLLIGRAGAGLVMLATPGFVANLWLGTRSRTGRRFVRAIGVRDLIICAGQLRARPHVGDGWRRFAAAADLFDAVVALGRAVTCRRALHAAIAVPAIGSAALTGLMTRSPIAPRRHHHAS